MSLLFLRHRKKKLPWNEMRLKKIAKTRWQGTLLIVIRSYDKVFKCNGKILRVLSHKMTWFGLCLNDSCLWEEWIIEGQINYLDKIAPDEGRCLYVDVLFVCTFVCGCTFLLTVSFHLLWDKTSSTRGTFLKNRGRVHKDWELTQKRKQT